MVKNKQIVEDEPKPIEHSQRKGRAALNGTLFKCGEEGHGSFKCPNVDKKTGDRRVVLEHENVDFVNDLKKEEENLFIQ